MLLRIPRLHPFLLSMYFVYILECADGSLYTGITTNLERRFEEHKSGKGGNYTRSRKVKKMVHSEKHPNRSEASKREAEIKKLSAEKKRALTTLNTAGSQVVSR